MNKFLKRLFPIGTLALTLLLGIVSPIKATVSSETDRVSYTCNGTTTAYNYTFKIYEDDDVSVTRKLTSTGAETALVINTDYTVSGAGGASGTVTLSAGSKCPSGYTLHLIRNVELTQETDYVEGATFPADSHEDALDKLTMEIQQQKSRANRAIKFPLTDNTDQVLGTASDRINKALGFDASGNLVLLGTSGTGSYSTFLTQENTFSEKQTFSKGIVSPFYNSNYTAAGTDTYTVTITGFTAYTTGDTYFITFTNANTIAAPTLNITSIGAKTLKKEGGVALVAGDIPVGHEGILRYNGTDIILLNPAIPAQFMSTTAAGTDTYTGTVSPAITAYVTGLHYFITFTNANTSATPTINLNSLGAKTIKLPGGVALLPSSIPANHPAIFKYDGTDMILLNPAKTPLISFSVNKGGVDQTTILTATPTKVTWPTVGWDVGSTFASDKWTPGKLGRYHSTVHLSSTTFGGSQMLIYIYKNGASYKEDIVYSNASIQTLTHDVDLDVDTITDYFEVYVTHNLGSNGTLSGLATRTWWQGHEVR